MTTKRAASTSALKYNLGQVPLDKIVDDGRNPRLASPVEKVKREFLAKSMGKFGTVLQPIMGFYQDKKFHLVFGNRRTTVARGLGWKNIAALILDEVPSDTVREALRGSENIDRLDLNHAEEVLLAVQMIDACGGDADAAAQELGRPVSWVRDRSYLAKLDNRVRDMLGRGEINLGQAREVVKWRDPKEQLKIAAEIVRLQNTGGPVAIEEIKNWFDEARRPLKNVAWDLQVPFAGKPSCIGCQYNTANDVGLFGVQTRGRVDEAFCAFGQCYDFKITKAGEEQRKNAQKVRNEVAEKRLDPEAATSIEHAKKVSPPWLKPEAMQAELKVAIPPPTFSIKPPARQAGSPAARPAPAPKPPSEKELRQGALAAWAGDFRKWRTRTMEVVELEAAKDGLKNLCVLALLSSKPLNDHPFYDAPQSAPEFTGRIKDLVAPADEPPASPALARVLTCIKSGTLQALTEIGESLIDPRKESPEAEFLSYLVIGPELTLAIARAFGVTVPPPPAFDVYLPDNLRPSSAPTVKREDLCEVLHGGTPGTSEWVTAVKLPQCHIKVQAQKQLSRFGPGFKGRWIAVYGRGSAASKSEGITPTDERVFKDTTSAVAEACGQVEAWLEKLLAGPRKQEVTGIDQVLVKLQAFMVPYVQELNGKSPATAGGNGRG